MLNYVILTSYSSHHYLMWNFTHTWMHNSVPLTCESLFFYGFQDLSMDHEQVLLAPYCLVGFFFSTSASSMGFHILTCMSFYPLWEPRTSPLSSSMGNNTFLLGFFQYRLCGLYGFVWCNIQSPLQLRKWPIFAPFTKRFQVHTLRSRSNCKRDLDNLSTFALHHHGF